MTDSTLIEQAKLGVPEAIAALMNQSLQSKGLRAIVDRQGECLEVILEAVRVPNRQALTSFVEKGISNLGIQSSPPITVVRILGRQTGASYPAWMQELKLGTSSAPVLPVDPLSIQSETAPSPVTMPGFDNFSSPPVTNAASSDAELNPTDWLDQPPLASGTDLNTLEELEALDDSAVMAEPDFLQELLASSADLPADESIEPTDEGLLDFLNELSDAPSAEPFPDETAQDLSNFAGTSPTEEGNFQELFAESAEFSLESELEPWEDSSESLPSGEPDADLLDFLAASDLDAETSFSPQLAEIHEFPDAASIDQLPENWISETTETTSNPLEEPPADFLTSLLDETPNIPVEPLSAVAPEQSIAAETWPEATPDSGEDLQQSLVNPSLADPWAEETFTAGAAAIPSEAEQATTPEPELDALPDYELSSVGLDSEPGSSSAEPPAEPPTWIQSTWIQPDAEATLLSEPFPAEPAAEASTWVQPDELDETLVEEEGLPDFLLAPNLDLPETDPVEMTYEAVLQQPDVLEATLTQEEFSLASADPLNASDAGQAEPLLEPSLNLDLNLDADRAAASEWAADPGSASVPSESIPSESIPSESISSESIEPEAPTSTDVWFVDQPESFSSETDFLQVEATDFSEAAQPLDSWIVEPPVTEPASAVEPELAELSSFADQQSTDLSWTETSEDFAVEEMPPDFLLELENEYLTGSDSGMASSEPGWTALEAELAAVDLTADLPDASATTDSPETMQAEIPALNLEDLVGPEVAATTNAEATLFEATDLAIEPHSDLELLAETAEGTAVEPPENWLASLRESAEPYDAEPDRSVAAEPPVVEPLPHPPLSSDPIVSNVTQDELEAGLGDFREGFVEPLPPEFFEDEIQPSYPDWRTDLGDPLSVHEDNAGAGYIIEDSEEIMPAVIPPAEAADDSDLEEAMEPRSSEWIFPAVLLTLCGLLAGWLGFSLFSSRIGPRQPAPPPVEEPPAPEQAPPAAPSPTSARPPDSWVSELPATLTDRN